MIYINQLYSVCVINLLNQTGLILAGFTFLPLDNEKWNGIDALISLAGIIFTALLSWWLASPRRYNRRLVYYSFIYDIFDEKRHGDLTVDDYKIKILHKSGAEVRHLYILKIAFKNEGTHPIRKKDFDGEHPWVELPANRCEILHSVVLPNNSKTVTQAVKILESHEPNICRLFINGLRSKESFILQMLINEDPKGFTIEGGRMTNGYDLSPGSNEEMPLTYNFLFFCIGGFLGVLMQFAGLSNLDTLVALGIMVFVILILVSLTQKVNRRKNLFKSIR